MRPAPEKNLADKVRYLASPGALVPGETPAARETHMSWVFLTSSLVFKLKKPVRQPYLDFTTCALREAACREELRINQTLAPDVYLRLARLTREPEGSLKIDGEGVVEDWLVVMRRLDDHLMLDKQLRKGDVARTAIEQLADLLGRFYAAATPGQISPDAYVERFRHQLELDSSVICRLHFRIAHQRAAEVLAKLQAQLKTVDAELRERAASGFIIEGHGDLRPEHVSLGDPIRVIDRLEFNRDLRMVDPFDELAFLGMECAVADAPWVEPLLFERTTKDLCVPSPDLIAFYRASRASLRARLSLAHLLDATPREPLRWEPQAERYLDQAENSLSPRRP